MLIIIKFENINIKSHIYKHNYYKLKIKSRKYIKNTLMNINKTKTITKIFIFNYKNNFSPKNKIMLISKNYCSIQKNKNKIYKLNYYKEKMPIKDSLIN